MTEETIHRIQEEIFRNVQRAQKALELATAQKEPEVGLTPRTLVYRRNKSCLYRYHLNTTPTHRTPLLMVPNLGISRPYIFDLRPGMSFIEFMVRQGFDFYLLDWGVFGEEDNGLTIDDCVEGIIPVMVRKVLESSGKQELSILGYCMGAPLSSSYVALHPEVSVRNYVNMAGPIDFSKAGLFTSWLDKRYFDVDKLVDTMGGLPASMVQMGFKFLKPTMDLTTYVNLWWNLWNDEYVEGFRALNKWANEYVPFPAEFFRQWVKDFYQDNKLVRKELRVHGRLVDLGTIRCPLLVVGAKEDNIAPPECVRALMDHVASREKEYVDLPGGHISLVAGRQASGRLWPRVSSWLAQRSC